MSIYKTDRSPYWLYDFRRNGERFHGSTGCTKKRDAERYEENLKAEAALGNSKRAPITLNAASAAFWEDNGKHERNSKGTDYQLEMLCTHVGGSKLMSAIRQEDFRRYVAKRRAHLSNASVNRELEVARRLWKHALGGGKDVPYPGTENAIDWSALMLPEPKERVRELSQDEEARLFAALEEDAPDLLPVVEFAMLSGQRRTSVIELEWDRVNLREMRVTMTGKGDKIHTFPLTDRMVEILLMQPVVDECPFVFTYKCRRPSPKRADRPARRKGVRYPFSRQGWVRQWRKALAKAVVADFRFHDLRHTTATRLVRATGNLKAAQKLLNHTDIGTTARYAHVAEDDLRIAMIAGQSRNSTEEHLTTTREKRRISSEKDA